ncbi:MAG: mechanosensitive ion channel, partial [Psychromonas sp.]|nr:mechanosensitive ion channel [Psychromonas sp.]
FEQLKKQQQALLDDQETLPVKIAEQEQLVEKQRKASTEALDISSDKIDKWQIEVGLDLQETKLKWLSLQQDTLVQRRELLKINTQILESQLTLSNKQIELLQARLLEVSTKSSLKVIEQAKQLSRALADAPEIIQQWNIKNEALAVEFEALNRELLTTQKARQQLEVQRQRVIQNLAQIKGNIKWLKNSPAFSDAIDAQLQQLPDLSDKSNLARAITAAHLKHFKLSTELSKLKDIPSLIAETDETTKLNRFYKKALSAILNFRYEVLTNSLEKTDQFIAEITRLDALQDQFAAEIQEERDFLKEKQLFIQDRVALWELGDMHLQYWFGVSNWSERWHNLLHKNTLHGTELLLFGLSFLFISVLIVHLKKTEKRYRLVYAKVVGKAHKDAFSHTFILLLLSICYGALLSFCLYAVERLIALRFRAFYSDDLKNLFIYACTLILIWESLVRMTVADGVLQLHFGYSKKVLSWLKSTLSKQRWVLYSFLLIMLVSEMLAENADSPLLRIVFIIFIFWLIRFFNILLKRQHIPLLLPTFFQSATVLQLLRAVMIVPFIAIATLAIWGYFYASKVALFYYYVILLSIICALLLQQLGVRWLKIEQRRVSWQRRLEKRKERLQQDKSAHSVVGEADESVFPLEEISEQSLTLLNLAVVIFLLVMISTLLSDSLLALQWMNDLTVWEVVTMTDTGNIVEVISLKALLSALIILGLSLFLSKNLPGFLELLLLHRLKMSAASIYATTTLLRYSVVVIGFLVTISTLGFHWSKLQWLVAALSVGLGFGLQEIFANLVSGIILLFERPIRVGDTITIQGLSGVVTRIDTRATTILDWDKKEIIVPNKSLLTEQLVNWSLSDASTRIILPVGVAYGSDVQLVKDLLIQAASECDGITQEPAPQALFLLFGASSLDFELRVFLPQVEGRSIIKDELNTRIEQLFKQHQIEIPFPQMDIHVRE